MRKTKTSDRAARRLYPTSDACAAAFAKEALPPTHADFRERGAVIYSCKVLFDGESGYRDMYFFDRIMKGMHNNVIWCFIFQRFLKSAPAFSAKYRRSRNITDIRRVRRFAFAHTHPYCTCHSGECFSPADKSLVSIWGMKRCYLAAPSGSLYSFCRAGSKKGGAPTVSSVKCELPSAVDKMTKKARRKKFSPSCR